MILVDTSVLIGYLKGNTDEVIRKLDDIIQNDIPFGINSLIYQEVLQGAKNSYEFYKLNEYLGELRFFELKDLRSSYEQAALMYVQCRMQGITIRSTIDLLIAQTAIENNLFLLHNDRDFNNISSVINNLRLY